MAEAPGSRRVELTAMAAVAAVATALGGAAWALGAPVELAEAVGATACRART